MQIQSNINSSENESKTFTFKEILAREGVYILINSQRKTLIEDIRVITVKTVWDNLYVTLFLDKNNLEPLANDAYEDCLFKETSEKLEVNLISQNNT